jgi:hypothetical protein
VLSSKVAEMNRWPAGQVGRGIGPCEHPRWMLDFNDVMKEVTQAIERLPLRIHTHHLACWRLTWESENARLRGQVKVTIDQFEQVVLMQNAEGAALEGIWVAQRMLGFIQMDRLLLVALFGQADRQENGETSNQIFD